MIKLPAALPIPASPKAPPSNEAPPTAAAPPAVAAPDPSFTPRFPRKAFQPVATTVSPFFKVTPEPPKPNKPPGVLVGPVGCVVFGVVPPPVGVTGLPPFPLPSPPFTFTTDADTFISPTELPRGFPEPPEPPVIRSYRLFPPLNSFSPPDNPRNPAK